jgi:hypothetical protein
MSYPILSNAFKQAVVGEYSDTDTVIELASISDTVGNSDFLPDPASGEYNVILYDTLFGNPADANNGGSYEIMRVTSINYGDNEITVTRGQDNSSAVTITDRPFAVLYGATAKWFTDVISEIDGKEDADPTILKEADVIDNLTSTDTDKPLSANQGKVLQDGKEPADATILKQADIVDNLTSTSTAAPLSANQGKVLEDNKVDTSAIVNDLTTGGTTVPASAETVKVLNEKFKVLQVVEGTRTTALSVSSTSYVDLGLQAEITPKSTSNKVLVLIQVSGQTQIGTNSFRSFSINAVRGGSQIRETLVQVRAGVDAGGFVQTPLAGILNVLDSPNTDVATTYKVQGKVSNTANSTAMLTSGGNGVSSITLIEIEA